jgi:hypothetical protein
MLGIEAQRPDNRCQRQRQGQGLKKLHFSLRSHRPIF